MANSAFGVHRGKAAGSRFDERHQEFTMVTSPPTEVLNSDRRYDVAALLLQPPRDFISSSSPEAYRRKPHTVRMVISTTALFLLLFSLMTFPSRQTAFAVGGSVVGWGADDYGAISVPTDATNIVALAAGVVHTLALREDGSLIRWGHAAELPPPGTSNLTSIAAGSFHSMGIRTDGSLWIWSPGQAVMNYPPSATNLIKVSAGNIHVMALRADGRVFAWGEDFWGATVVPGEATNIVDIAAGGTFSVGLRSDGSVLVWGLPGRFTLALSNIVAIGAQYDSVWALRDDGRVFVGNSDSGLSNIVAMDGAAFHWIALSKDGTVAVVGSNSQGQGTIPPGLGNVAAVAAEGEHNLALFNVAGVQIQTPPRSQTSLAGDGVLLSCKALGTMPLSYSWSRDGNLIAQTDVPYLWLRNVQAGDRGAYRATVTNFTGSVTSPPRPNQRHHIAPAHPAFCNKLGGLAGSYRFGHRNRARNGHHRVSVAKRRCGPVGRNECNARADQPHLDGFRPLSACGYQCSRGGDLWSGPNHCGAGRRLGKQLVVPVERASSSDQSEGGCGRRLSRPDVARRRRCPSLGRE